MTGEEHWEVASLADAFDEWATAPCRRGRRRPTKRLRLRTTRIQLAPCMGCGAVAEWHYTPSGPAMDYCDNCVPRGCTCRIIDEDQHIEGRTVIEAGPDGEEFVWTVYDRQMPREETDGFGRKLPCIEWEFYSGGFPRAEKDHQTSATRKAQEVADAAGWATFQASFGETPMADVVIEEDDPG